MTVGLSLSKLQISFSVVSAAAETVLPSAKLCKSYFEIKRKKSFLKILNKIGQEPILGQLQRRDFEIRCEYYLPQNFVNVF